MAIREVRKKGDEVLYKKCKEVTKFDERLHILLDDLYDTMKKTEGVGLASPQVGILKRAVVIEVEEGGRLELVNPEIIKTEGSQKDKEGCLSVPEEFYYVTRPYKVTVKAQDRFGNEFTKTGEGLLARAICHECDHLDGLLFLSKVDDFNEE
jgi:peptide deformylase